MSKHQSRLVRLLAVTATGGTCFQIGSCIPYNTVASYIANINPCGAILNCDPARYNFDTSGYRGPGVNPDIDPACTYPPFCDGDPFVNSAFNPNP